MLSDHLDLSWAGAGCGAGGADTTSACRCGPSPPGLLVRRLGVGGPGLLARGLSTLWRWLGLGLPLCWLGVGLGLGLGLLFSRLAVFAGAGEVPATRTPCGTQPLLLGCAGGEAGCSGGEAGWTQGTGRQDGQGALKEGPQ